LRAILLLCRASNGVCTAVSTMFLWKALAVPVRFTQLSILFFRNNVCKPDGWFCLTCVVNCQYLWRSPLKLPLDLFPLKIVAKSMLNSHAEEPHHTRWPITGFAPSTSFQISSRLLLIFHSLGPRHSNAEHACPPFTYEHPNVSGS
jgi:hypothetical protein